MSSRQVPSPLLGNVPRPNLQTESHPDLSSFLPFSLRSSLIRTPFTPMALARLSSVAALRSMGDIICHSCSQNDALTFPSLSRSSPTRTCSTPTPRASCSCSWPSPFFAPTWASGRSKRSSRALTTTSESGGKGRGCGSILRYWTWTRGRAGTWPANWCAGEARSSRAGYRQRRR